MRAWKYKGGQRVRGQSDSFQKGWGQDLARSLQPPSQGQWGRGGRAVDMYQSLVWRSREGKALQGPEHPEKPTPWFSHPTEGRQGGSQWGDSHCSTAA